MGARPAFVPNPTTASRNENLTCTAASARGADECVEPRDVVGSKRRRPRGVEQDDAEEADPEAGRRDQHILPRRLERRLGAVEGDQERRDHRGQLDGDPERAEIGPSGTSRSAQQKRLRMRSTCVRRAGTHRHARDAGNRPRTPLPRRRGILSGAGRPHRARRVRATARAVPDAAVPHAVRGDRRHGQRRQPRRDRRALAARAGETSEISVATIGTTSITTRSQPI